MKFTTTVLSKRSQAQITHTTCSIYKKFHVTGKSKLVEVGIINNPQRGINDWKGSRGAFPGAGISLFLDRVLGT